MKTTSKRGGCKGGAGGRAGFPAVLLCVLALGACEAVDDPAAPVTGTGLADLDLIVQSYLRDTGVPGAALTIIKDGKLVVAAGYGWADLARTDQVRPDHLFRWSSVSKSITGVAVVAAAEDGLLSLEDPAWSYLQDLLPEGGPADERLNDQRVEDLLWHTSGFAQFNYPLDLLFRMREVADSVGVPLPPDGDAVVRWSAGLPLAFQPFTGWAYTNLAYVILGRVLEAASGEPYEDYVRERVFGPAGATRPRIGGIGRDERLPDEVEYQSESSIIWLSVLDRSEDPVDEPAYGAINMRGMDASSGWVASVVDMARLAAAIDGDPTYPDILSAESVVTLHVPHGLPERTAYSAGFYLAQPSDAEAAGLDPVGFIDHSGGMPGSNAYFQLRNDGIGVAVAMNGTSDAGDFNTFLRSLLLTVSRIEMWPTVDLFERYP